VATTSPPIPLHAAATARAATAFERHGAEACDDAALLTLALGDGGNGIRGARELLDATDGLRGLACATPAELIAAGLTTPEARRLAAAIALGRRASGAWPEPDWRVRTPADVAERLMDAMGGLEREELWVLLLDTKNAVTARRTIYVGNLAGTSVRVGEVYRPAVRACAAAIVVAHNHPSGDPSPSGEDLRISAELAQAGRLLDIELLDHLVIGRGRWVSMRAVGALGQGAPTIL
jgi:DNA repair protein RadC